ncbi:hypothetical protein GF420_12870 [candidate division GN15 bacterium]|nr:hypothetical protein [candidate division GN15 bacterium]
MRKWLVTIIAIAVVVLIVGPGVLYLLWTGQSRPMATVEHVNLERFMGDWYVIANIPTFAERGAVNAIERYRLRDRETVDIRFTFRQDSADGEAKEYTATGFVEDTMSNASWKVQFFWPIKFPFKIIRLADDYSHTVIGVPNRKYVWIMSRTPELADSTYLSIVADLAEIGYDTAQVEMVPQVWPGSGTGGE